MKIEALYVCKYNILSTLFHKDWKIKESNGSRLGSEKEP